MPRNQKHKCFFSIIYIYMCVYYINQDLNASHSSIRSIAVAIAWRFTKLFFVGVVVTFNGETSMDFCRLSTIHGWWCDIYIFHPPYVFKKRCIDLYLDTWVYFSQSSDVGRWYFPYDSMTGSYVRSRATENSKRRTQNNNPFPTVKSRKTWRSINQIID